MATPVRESPISYRLGREREARFRAFQAAQKLTQSDALHALIDIGLDSKGFGVPSKDPKAKSRWKV